MIMKKKTIVKINSLLNKIKDLGETKFKYSIIKNISMLSPHIKVLSEIEMDIKSELKDFEKERNELIKRIGKKSDDTYYIDLKDASSISIFNEELKPITEKYRENLDNFERKMIDFNSILEEEIEEEIKFRSIDISDCPKSGINSDQLELLMENNIII